MGRIFTQDYKTPSTLLKAPQARQVDFGTPVKTSRTIEKKLPTGAGETVVEAAKNIGQGAMRGFAQTGAMLTSIPEQVRALVSNTPARPNALELKPTGRIQKALYGTDEKIGPTQVSKELGIPENSPFALPVAAGFSMLDLSGTGAVGKPVVKFLKSAIGGVVGKSVEETAKEYLKIHKNIIDTDAARELFDSYRADRTSSGAVQAEAKAVAEAAYQIGLKTQKGAGNNTVMMTSGGMGAGKSTAVRAAAKDYALVFDGNLDTYATAAKRVDDALKAGYDVDINYFYKPLVEAIDSAMRRAEKMAKDLGSGRTASTDIFVTTHVDSLTTLQKLLQKYEGDARVNFAGFDQSGGGSQLVENLVDFLKKNEYTGNVKAYVEQIKQHISKSLAEGKVSSRIAEGFTRTKDTASVADNAKALKNESGSASEGVLKSTSPQTETGKELPSSSTQRTSSQSANTRAESSVPNAAPAEQGKVSKTQAPDYSGRASQIDSKKIKSESPKEERPYSNEGRSSSGGIPASQSAAALEDAEARTLKTEAEAARKSDTPSFDKPITGIPEPARADFNASVATESAKAEDPKLFRSVAKKLKNAAVSFLEYIQDQQIRVRKLVEDKNLKVSDASNPYQKAMLYSGRVGRKIEEGYEKSQDIATDIVRTANKTGIDSDVMRTQVNEYLQALHAPERNAALGEGAAGMATEEARAIVARATPEMKAIGEKVLALNKEILDNLKESGVISDELYKTLRERYKNHVPLQRIFENDDDVGSILSGKGFDVRSTGIKHAVGSERKVADILTNVVTNYEQAILRSEKNIVDQATLAFIRDNEEALKDIMVIRKPRPVGKTFDGAPILERTDDPTVLQMFEEGKRVWVQFKDPHVAVAFKSIGKEKLPAFLRWIGSFTRFYSGLATRFNPEFALPNKLRDLQETAVYIAAQKDMGFGAAGRILTRDPSNWKAVIDAMRGKDTVGAKLYNEMRELGGTTGGFGLSTRKKVEMNLDNIFKTANSTPRRGTQKLIEYVDAWNTLFEDSTRLTVYKEALAKGASKERAAFLAKEASINFNKMGRGGPVINALWMFSNASIQGTAKMVRSLANPKVAAAVTVTVASAVAATAEWNDRIDPDWRDKVTKWDRLNGLVLVLPNKDGNGVAYITIPVSWGIKPIKVAADYAYDGLSGEDFEIGDMGSTLMSTILDAYNPVGGTDFQSAITPTILDVPSELARNKSWNGARIRPDFNPDLPPDVQYFDSLGETGTGRAFIEGTKELQKYTGLAVSPAVLDYAFQQYAGGAGRTVKKTANTLFGAVEGDVPPPDEFPMVSRFLRQFTEEEVGAGTPKSLDIKKLEQEQARESFYKKQQAQEIWDTISKLPRGEMIDRLKQLKKDDKTLHDKVVDIGEAAKLNLQGVDKQLKTATVETRARYILDQLDKTKTPEERQALVDQYREKKILTESVAKRIKELKAER